MAITTTLGAIVAAGGALQRLASLPISMKASYHVSKLQKLATDEARQFASQRSALVARLGEDRPATEAEAAAGLGPPFVAAANLAEFHKLVEELLAVPVTIEWAPFDLGVIEAENVARERRGEAPIIVTAADLNALGLHTDGALVLMEATT
jgi:hypothetical protein